MGSRIQLVCMCEAYPRPIAIWITPTDIPIIANPSTQQSATTTIISIGNRSLLSNLTETIKNLNNKKYEANEEYHGFRTTMRLIINYLTIEDFGTFKCLAKNSLGEKEGLIRVYGKYFCLIGLILDKFFIINHHQSHRKNRNSITNTTRTKSSYKPI